MPHPDSLEGWILLLPLLGAAAAGAAGAFAKRMGHKFETAGFKLEKKQGS